MLAPVRPLSPLSRPAPAPAAASAAIVDDWRLDIPVPARRALRLWFWSIAAMTLVVLVVGGITRLTQSGLSIVDWKPVMGVVPPLGEAAWQETFDRYRQFPEYLELRRNMTLDEFKVIFFWEYLHRIVARLIGVVFLVPFAIFRLRGHLTGPLLRRSLALFGLGALQGLMGWLMVKSGLVDRPSVSHYRLAAHLGLAFVIFGSAVWLARELSVDTVRRSVPVRARLLIRNGLAVIGVLLALQVLWGAFVAGLKAGLIFNTFPLMAGALVPPNLLPLSPGLLNFVQHPTAVQWTHRVLGSVLLIAVLALYVQVRRTGADGMSRRLNDTLLVLVAGQYLLGVLTLIYVVPLFLAVVHQATAMIIAGVWVVWFHHCPRVQRVSGET
jgi:cytochrome c oxidase assembly protein subunit 15